MTTPGKLNFAGGPTDVEVITNGIGVRQVKTPYLLANVITTNIFGYSIEYFAGANVGSKVGGLYQTSGVPYLTWTVENPDASTNSYNSLRIIESRPNRSITNLYVYAPGSETWTLYTGNGLRKESKQTTWSANNTIRTEVVEIRDGATDALVSKVQKKFQLFSWGEGLIEEKVDPDNLALKTSYTYGTSGDDLGLITSVDYPDGNWTRYVYFGKRLGYKYTAYLNDTNSGASASSYYYGSLDTNDNLSLEPYTPRGINIANPSRGVYNVIAPGISTRYEGHRSLDLWIAATWLPRPGTSPMVALRGK